MSTELICPDCGGVIGADASEVGRACTCFSANSAATEVATKTDVAPIEIASIEAASTDDVSGDTVVERVEEAPKAKVCCQCGKDLNGHRRLRDSRGYWCYACHKLDKEANKPKGVACADCGRIVPEAALGEYEGRQICGACRSEHKDLAKEQRRLSPVKTTAHDEMAKKSLLWVLAVVGVLLIIILLRTFRIIGH
jgi:ribosomal protein L34E